ncbi:PRD domain-containing protein [Pseudalkalibacillus decolorationis]|uniref:PRD domain-containing protein n=1 Tax=Pseudalkalibacillus decolorationis TaxID=163879 RepID=UPI002148A67C|nr:PRD domain-containing protein [Pseudalkalibacillus decolorationis]
MERRIVKVLGHNVVLAKLPSGNNSIVFGKAIGFKKETNALIDPSSITQEFLLHTTEAIEHYQQVIELVNLPVISATEEVIAMAIEELPGPFSDTIHAALIDHINFAIERHKKGMRLSNPFAFEIQHLYPDEYKIAEKAVAYLKEKLEVDLPEEEVAFLATHFHSARSFRKNKSTLEVARTVSTILDTLKTKGYDMESSLSMVRLVSHLRVLMDRVKSGKTIDNPLLANIREIYPETFAIAREIGDFITEALEVEVPDEEVGFITLHLERCHTEPEHKK